MKRLLSSALALFLLVAPARAGDVSGSVQVDTSGTLPDGIAVKGTIERVVTWTDDDGRHAAVFASVAKEGQRGGELWWSKTLTVTTFVAKGASMKKVREVKEVVNPCQLDMTARFVDPTIGVSDLDANGLGELTFAYVTRCAGDVSPMAMKLLVLERDKKWILRGETKVDVGGGEIVGGTYKADFKKAPPALLAHAQKVWDANVTPAPAP